MKVNELIVKSFFEEKRGFCETARILREEGEKTNNPRLKVKIIKFCLSNCSISKHEFIMHVLQKVGSKIDYTNHSCSKSEQKDFLRKDLKLTDAFLKERAVKCFKEYFSIKETAIELFKKGENRKKICLVLNVSEPTLIRYLSGVSRSGVTKSYPSPLQEKKAIKEFEKYHFEGRLITNEMKRILEKNGLLEKYT